MDSLLRVYLDPAEIGRDDYPIAWHRETYRWIEEGPTGELGNELVPAIKDYVRERDGHRCLRCLHPYQHGSGEWSPCDEECRHTGPYRIRTGQEPEWCVYEGTGLPFPGEAMYDYGPGGEQIKRWEYEAQWRILTVHHLNGIKHDCRWWNLVSLCQRCHLTIQGKVYMERPWTKPHSEWFQPVAAGFYAWKYLDLELAQEATLERLDELLELELTQEALF